MKKNISRIVPLFMELLLSALWKRKANSSLFEQVYADLWWDILKYAKFQKVVALVYDGIQTLPEILKPSQELLIFLAVHTEIIEKRNEKLNETLVELTRIYKEMDCSFLLLKGQGIALYYPDPLHRTPGDQDLFLYKENDYLKAKQWVERLGVKMEIESPKHLGFDWQNIHVENHAKVAQLNNSVKNRSFQQYITTAVEQAETCKLGNIDIRVLPPEANAIFLFAHLFIHFMKNGIGIRQLCDWILFLQANRHKIEAASCIIHLKSFGLLKPARIFAKALVDKMEAPEEIFPFFIENEKKMSEKIMNDIWEGGDFGLYRIGLSARPHGKWGGYWHSFSRQSNRACILWRIAPNYFFNSVLKRVWLRSVLTITGKG